MSGSLSLAPIAHNGQIVRRLIADFAAPMPVQYGQCGFAVVVVRTAGRLAAGLANTLSGV